jgi:hypothetical protein
VAAAAFVEAAVAFSFRFSTTGDFPHFIAVQLFLMNSAGRQPRDLIGLSVPALWIVTNSGAPECPPSR